jgi:hypothetical protein
MRTVLAVDDLLASLLAKRLLGEVESYGRCQMRKDGDEIVLDAARRAPCVLVIGGRRWNPLRLVDSWKLPRTTAVVAIVPRIRPVAIRRAAAAGVLSVTASMPGVVDALADEWVIAAAVLTGLRPRSLRPRVLVADCPPRPVRQTAASVLLLRPGSSPRQVA